jgi:hypothetical protein
MGKEDISPPEDGKDKEKPPGEHEEYQNPKDDREEEREGVMNSLQPHHGDVPK